MEGTEREDKIVKISSNDSVPMIYLPKKIRQALKLEKGVYVRLLAQDDKLIVIPLRFEKEEVI